MSHGRLIAAQAMRRFVVAFLAMLLTATSLAWSGNADARRHADPVRGADTVAVSDLPPEARTTLGLIRAGAPFAYSRDGITFGNYEGRLPPQRRGYYHEYTVPTPGARNRGARRIIVGEGGADGSTRRADFGEYWYTDDHYQTFRRITP